MRGVKSAQRALAWFERQELPTGGIRVHARSTRAYPEVTGYGVPTLLAYGAQETARRWIDWLLCVQRADGSYPCPDTGRARAFDTAQVLRGLLASSDHGGSMDRAAQRAARCI